VSPQFQKRSALKFAGRTIPPQAEDIADIRGIPEALAERDLRPKLQKLSEAC